MGVPSIHDIMLSLVTTKSMCTVGMGAAECDQSVVGSVLPDAFCAPIRDPSTMRMTKPSALHPARRLGARARSSGTDFFEGLCIETCAVTPILWGRHTCRVCNQAGTNI